MATPAPRPAQLAPGEAHTLADLAAYAPGAIVSRTLAQTPAGSVTLFAFDQGQALSEHTAPFDALVQVIDGQGRFLIGGQACDVAAGQVVLMPAHVPHAVEATRRFKMVLTMLRK